MKLLWPHEVTMVSTAALCRETVLFVEILFIVETLTRIRLLLGIVRVWGVSDATGHIVVWSFIMYLAKKRGRNQVCAAGEFLAELVP
ncbi:MAG: hypothetical protein K6U74_08425 [Firmicutes bacterium]|nr:hypothetical protein [Bacillota bacterium]